MSQKLEHIIFVLSYVYEAIAQGSNYQIPTLRKKATEKRASEVIRFDHALGRFVHIDPRSVHDAFTDQLRPQKQTVDYFDNVLFEWIKRNNMAPLRSLLSAQESSDDDRRAIANFLSKYSI